MTGLCWISTNAQPSHEFPSPEMEDSHAEYIHIVREADSLLYKQIINLYESWITDHPGDIRTRIEYCKFIEKVFYNDFEEYNPKYQEHQACLDKLLSDYPEHPAVIIYNITFVEGDSTIQYMESLTGRIENEPEIWDMKGLWKVYEKLAYEHSYQGNNNRAVAYARDAMQMNKELDLSLLIARSYMKSENDSSALSSLIQNIDSTNTTYDLYEKGDLFHELEAYDQALQAYEWSAKDWDMDEELGRTLTKLGRYEEARPYFLKESNKNWNNRRSLEQLFLFDLEYSHADSALATYNRMRDIGFKSDPLLIYRLRLAFGGGGLMSDWQMRDFPALMLLTVIFVIIFVIPYMWILPIYSYGIFKRDRMDISGHSENQPASSMRWGLRQFWLISAAYLSLGFIIQLIYNYSNLVGYLNSDLYEDFSISQAELANSSIFFIIAFALITLCFLRKDDIQLFWGDNISKVRQLMTGFGYIIFLRIVFILIHQLFLTGQADGIGIFSFVTSIEEEIHAINSQYGYIWVFLFVVLLVPVYEEIIFRGIILDSVSKYLSFRWANLIQSVMFALLHENFELFFFYVFFGLLAGHLRNRTGGFAASISFHAINNLIATIILL